MDGVTRGADGYWDIGAFEFPYAGAHLINVHWGEDFLLKTGPELYGVYAADYWNFDYGYGVYGALDFAGNSTSVDITTPMGEVDTVGNSANNLFNGYVLNKGGADFQIEVTLPAGTYGVILYSDCINSMTFTLSVDEQELASGSISSVTLESPGTLVINCHSETQSYVNGLQIAW